MDGAVYNLHNHTPFSDGAYTIDELCEAHLELTDVKVAGIGISDDLFRTPSSREPADAAEFERIFGKEARSYIATVREAQRRWAGKLRVFCGCEINWPLNRAMLDPIRGFAAALDYVLFSFVNWAGLTQLANQARRWPCPVGLAQTRVCERFPNTHQDQVVRTMANARIFYELNAGHMPIPQGDAWFRILPNHRVLVTLGTDTHDDLSALKLLRPMNEFVHRSGLGPRMLEVGERAEQVMTA